MNAVRPSGYVGTVGDAEVEVKASDEEVLFVLGAGYGEALEDVVAADGEGVVRVGDRIGFEIYLAARTEDGQAELVGQRTSFIFLLRWGFVAVVMSVVESGDVPGCVRVCGVEVILDLLLGDRLETQGVG